jgi:copper(I)-binding protein
MMSNDISHIWRAARFAACAILLATLASPTWAAATIQVTDAWTRATPGTSSSAAVYFTMTNSGKEADTLTGAETPAAASAELHETMTMGGMTHMTPTKEVDVPAGATVSFAPNGRHLMLMGLKKPLHKGDAITVTLYFEKAGAIDVKVPVLDVAALGPHPH